MQREPGPLWPTYRVSPGQSTFRFIPSRRTGHSSSLRIDVPAQTLPNQLTSPTGSGHGDLPGIAFPALADVPNQVRPRQAFWTNPPSSHQTRATIRLLPGLETHRIAPSRQTHQPMPARSKGRTAPTRPKPPDIPHRARTHQPHQTHLTVPALTIPERLTSTNLP